MKFIPKQPSITEEGLESYLERTRGDHNNYGYEEFTKRVELEEPKTILAKAFGVNKKTIYKWLDAYSKEKANV